LRIILPEAVGSQNLSSAPEGPEGEAGQGKRRGHHFENALDIPFIFELANPVSDFLPASAAIIAEIILDSLIYPLIDVVRGVGSDPCRLRFHTPSRDPFME
jgi:hypothetical protein